MSIIKPTFIMLVGIPGSGKTTYAECYMKRYESTKHISSDAIRKELYGDENCQEDHNKVFTIMRDRTLEALRNGYDVLYDATNVSRKNRKSILDQLPPYVTKECMIIWASIEDCIKRDAARERTVGEDVIMKIVKRFEAPWYDEGFDRIAANMFGYQLAGSYFEDCVSAMNIPHDNPHHSANIAEHCHLCRLAIDSEDVPDFVKFTAGVHDIGKPLTKTFTNTKGEVTDVAHYYGHQAVGAWMAYGFSEFEPAVPWLISTHMAPFINLKYYNSLAPLYKTWIDALHKADRAAH
jgi:predicted kinase